MLLKDHCKAKSPYRPGFEEKPALVQFRFEKQLQIPIRLRSGQAFYFLRYATVAQNDSLVDASHFWVGELQFAA